MCNSFSGLRMSLPLWSLMADKFSLNYKFLQTINQKEFQNSESAVNWRSDQNVYVGAEETSRSSQEPPSVSPAEAHQVIISQVYYDSQSEV